MHRHREEVRWICRLQGKEVSNDRFSDIQIFHIHPLGHFNIYDEYWMDTASFVTLARFWYLAPCANIYLIR